MCGAFSNPNALPDASYARVLRRRSGSRYKAVQYPKSSTGLCINCANLERRGWSAWFVFSQACTESFLLLSEGTSAGTPYLRCKTSLAPRKSPR